MSWNKFSSLIQSLLARFEWWKLCVWSPGAQNAPWFWPLSPCCFGGNCGIGVLALISKFWLQEVVPREGMLQSEQTCLERMGFFNLESWKAAFVGGEREDGQEKGNVNCVLLYLACFIYLFELRRVLNEPCKASLPVMLERKAKDQSLVLLVESRVRPRASIAVVRCYTSALLCALCVTESRQSQLAQVLWSHRAGGTGQPFQSNGKSCAASPLVLRRWISMEMFKLTCPQSPCSFHCLMTKFTSIQLSSYLKLPWRSVSPIHHWSACPLWAQSGGSTHCSGWSLAVQGMPKLRLGDAGCSVPYEPVCSTLCWTLN